VIGVCARQADLTIAAEFFELFKTPWEPATPGRRYTAIISTDGRHQDFDTNVVIAFGAEVDVDRLGLVQERLSGPVDLMSDRLRLPIYGQVVRFEGSSESSALTLNGGPVIHRTLCGPRTVWRVGYDLLAEVRRLLNAGQPPSRAEIPTLEHHAAIVRRLLLASGVSFVEIPPRPAGFDFACALTHDLDFFGIRRHAFDRTLAGFAVRASLSTFVELVRGRRPFGEAVRNWTALCSLPAVMLRLAPDFWRPFDDYAKADRGLPSTFFLVPVKGKPGVGPDGTTNSLRAVPYQISEIREEIGRVVAQGSEVAVHGIDAWRDDTGGRAEKTELTAVTGQTRVGIRMHWLYFSERSPKALDDAGYDYDSTCGYNEAVGYRAGTSQAFQIPGTRLMELPLSIMDSAMFFPDRMALPRDEARRRWREILTNARRLGGTVVVNWHDRSLVPERQWGQPYADLLDDLQEGDRAWFGTASQVTDWFRWRRSMTFEDDGDTMTVVAAPRDRALPGATVRVHRADGSAHGRVEERVFDGGSALTLAL
jgi:hypothetical protein